METYCLRMSQELAKHCSIESIVLPGRKDGRGPTGLSMFWFGFLSAIKVPFRSPVDAVHLGDVAIWPLGYLELLFNRTKKLLLSAHGSDVSLAKRAGWRSAIYGIYLRLGARIVRRATVIANSAYIATLAHSAGFEDVVVVPLGTDFVEREHPARSGLLFAGRVSRAKGVRFLVAGVLPFLPETTLLRIAGPMWEESERDLLGHPQVEYLGVLSQDELAAEYSRATITVIPSQIEEGFGLVAIEAAACGSQVVASNEGGLREAVRAPWGELVNPDDPKAWATSINQRLAASASERNRIGQLAKLDVDLHFRWSEAAVRTLAQYQAS